MRKPLACRAAILPSMRSIVAIAAAVGIGLAGAASAKASTITETFTFPTLDSYAAENGSSFSAFDPALGTLNSVTLDITATAHFTGGGDGDDNAAFYTFNFPSVEVSGFSTFATAQRNGAGTAQATTSITLDPPETSLFFGPGSITPSVSADNENLTSASIISTFGTETVTYDYTPAQIVPEASTWAMMLIGFAGLGVAASRRRGAVAVSA